MISYLVILKMLLDKNIQMKRSSNYMGNHGLRLDKYSRKELISLLLEVQGELLKFGDGELKDGQSIIIGSKHAKKYPFYGVIKYDDGTEEFSDNYEGIIGEDAYIDGGYLISIGLVDENGNPSFSTGVILERDRHKKRKKSYFIHPEDAIVIEEE